MDVLGVSPNGMMKSNTGTPYKAQIPLDEDRELPAMMTIR